MFRLGEWNLFTAVNLLWKCFVACPKPRATPWSRLRGQGRTGGGGGGKPHIAFKSMAGRQRIFLQLVDTQRLMGLWVRLRFRPRVNFTFSLYYSARRYLPTPPPFSDNAVGFPRQDPKETAMNLTDPTSYLPHDSCGSFGLSTPGLRRFAYRFTKANAGDYPCPETPFSNEQSYRTALKV